MLRNHIFRRIVLKNKNYRRLFTSHTNSSVPSTTNAKKQSLSLLSEEELISKLEPLRRSGWMLNRSDDSIQKTFQFKNFLNLWGFATQVAMETHKMNHHAQILVTSYDAVTIVFTTHSHRGLTIKDVKGAELCERAVSSPASNTTT